jgi:outer membrane protein TolC
VRRLFSLSFITCAQLANAQEPPPRAMTLDEALTFATAHHPKLLAASARLDAANRDAEVPTTAWLPRIGAMAQIVAGTTNNSTASLVGTSTVDLPRIGATAITASPEFVPYASTAIAVGIRQQIWDFGRTSSEEAAARLLRDIESYRARGAAFDIRYAVASAYYGVLAAAAVQSASEAALERATQHRDYAQANVRSGLRPPIELTRAEADVARYEAALTRARGGLHIARTWFAATVGV